MRVPLSWLRDFAPFDGDPADLAATLDDLGLVVEEIELVGEGLGDVVVARVERDRRPSTVPTGSAGWWSTPAPDRSRWCAAPGTSRWATWCPWPRSARSSPAGSPSGAGR